MELKWLDDLVALAEEGSLSQAALRRNTTQPAFSRRIQAIEEWLGTTILDRSARPAKISGAITRHIDDIRGMSRNIKRFRNDVQGFEQSHWRVAVATQHALSVTFFPAFIAAFHQNHARSAIMLRSANRDESFSLLMTGQAAVLVVYEAENFPLGADEALIERATLRTEKLVPVVSREHAHRLLPAGEEAKELPVIAYPDDVFFGKILTSHIWPKLSEGLTVRPVCETAHVPAVASLAREGAGIAWVPESILHYATADQRLIGADERLGTYQLAITAMRLKTPRSTIADKVWKELTLHSAR